MNEYNPFNYSVAQLRKAILGALTAVAMGLAAVYSDGVITTGEWFFLVGEALASFGVVFGVPNAE